MRIIKWNITDIADMTSLVRLSEYDASIFRRLIGDKNEMLKNSNLSQKRSFMKMMTKVQDMDLAVVVSSANSSSKKRYTKSASFDIANLMYKHTTFADYACNAYKEWNGPPHLVSYNCGLVFYYVQRYEKAIENFDNARKLDPTYVKAKEMRNKALKMIR